MNIKQKIKSAWQRITGKNLNKSTDSELGADEVVKKEVFPKSKAKTDTKASAKKCCSHSSAKSSCTHKPASKRTRPTNDNYQMIDPSDDTFDAGKS